jgi:hypothetical protein
VAELFDLEGRVGSLLAGGRGVADDQLGALAFGAGGLQHRGTCSVFRGRYLLTAAHCVDGAAPEDLLVALLWRDLYRIDTISIHDSADVAVLKVARDLKPMSQPTPPIVSDLHIGDDFVALGFPLVGEGAESLPTVRLLKGHVQRYVNHRSSMRYTYYAGELSVPCPKGCSGAPLYRDGYGSPGLTGIITENVRVAMEVSRLEEIEKTSDHTTMFVQQDVTRYGLCVVLKNVAEWLDEVAPA